ncbi:MAG: hypothetical protein HC927_01385 [Deltaproteobacteria bacterium]|nr:hypothetical protein [Deltaproteobacteria bacterium]
MREYVIENPNHSTFNVSMGTGDELQVSYGQRLISEDEVICLVLDPGESAQVYFRSGNSNLTLTALDESSSQSWSGSGDEVSQVLTARIDDPLAITLGLGDQEAPAEVPKKRKIHIKTRGKGTLPGEGGKK